MLEDPALREQAAQEFVRFELSISKVHVDLDDMEKRLANPSAFMPFAACEIVYMLADGFSPTRCSPREPEEARRHRHPHRARPE